MKETDNIPEEVFELISKDELYGKTGIQILNFNTIFQLYYLAKYKADFDELNDKADAQAKVLAKYEATLSELEEKLTVVNNEIDEKTEKEIVSRFLQNYSGAKNASKPILKKDGVEFSVIDSGIADANSMQLEQNREFTQKIISEIFGVPVSFLNGENISDIESVFVMFAENAIRPITNTFSEYFQNLFRIEDRGKYFIKWNFDSLLKTSLNNRITSLTQQINNGQLTPNEARKLSDLPEVPGGDYLYRNSALLPIREDIESSLAASAKQKQQELIEQATHTEKNSEAENLGSDKL